MALIFAYLYLAAAGFLLLFSGRCPPANPYPKAMAVAKGKAKAKAKVAAKAKAKAKASAGLGRRRLRRPAHNHSGIAGEAPEAPPGAPARQPQTGRAVSPQRFIHFVRYKSQTFEGMETSQKTNPLFVSREIVGTDHQTPSPELSWFTAENSNK